MVYYAYTKEENRPLKTEFAKRADCNIMKKYESRCEADTRRIAAELAATLKKGDIVALHGDLGAGKTAFVRGVADFFRSEDAVTSPTFTIVNEYYGDTVIYHFDAYRIENASFEQCDWMDDYFFGDGICIVEWAENIAAVLPEGYITVKRDKNPDKGTDYREITIC